MMKQIINLLLVIFVYNSCGHHDHHHHTWNHHHRTPDNTWNHQYRTPDNTWNHRQRTPAIEYPTIVRFQNLTHRSYFVLSHSPTGYSLRPLPPDFAPSSSGSYSELGNLPTIRSKNEYWPRNRVNTYQSNPQSQVPQQSYLPMSYPNTVSQQTPFHNYIHTAKQQNQNQPRYADPIHSQRNLPPISPNTVPPRIAPHNSTEIRQDLLRQYVETTIPWQNRPRTYPNNNIPEQNPSRTYPNAVSQQNPEGTYSVPTKLEKSPRSAFSGKSVPEYSPPPIHPNPHHTYSVTTAPPLAPRRANEGTIIPQQKLPSTYQGFTLHQQMSPPPRPYPGSNGAPQQNSNHTYSVQKPPRAAAGTTFLRQNPSPTYQKPAVLQQTSSPLRPYQGSAVLQKNISRGNPESNGPRQNSHGPTETVIPKRTNSEKPNPTLLDPKLIFVEELFCDAYFIEREQQSYCNNETKQIFDGPGYILYIPIKVSRKESIQVKIKHRVLSVVAAGGQPQNQLLVLPSFVNTRNVGWQFNKGLQIYFTVKNQGSCGGSFDDTVRAVPRIARDRFTLNDVDLPFLT